MSDITNLENRLNSVMGEITVIIDEIIEIRKDSFENKQLTAKILEEFLSNLYHYIKTTSKESGDNLLAGISLMKIKLMN